MTEPEHISKPIRRVMPIQIVIPGRPATYQRKTGIWHAKDGRSGVNVYASKSYADWKSYARGRAAEICPREIAFPRDQPVVVNARLYFEVPKSAPRKLRVAAMARYLRPAGKPDLDNSLKAIADSCLTGIVIHDDRQIVEVHLAKWYDENPRVEIDVAPWIPAESKTLFNQEHQP